MLVHANPQTSQVSVDPDVRKIASVCDMHGVTFGSPADLAGFMGALDENKHLAMDFWAIVARMSDEQSAQSSRPSRESGETLNGRMLEVIVEGVTGRCVAEVTAGDSEQEQLVGRLASLLAGQDVPAAEAENVESVDARGAAGARNSEFDAGWSPWAPRTLVPLPSVLPDPAPPLAPPPSPIPPAPVWQEPESTPVRRSDETPPRVLEPEPLPSPGASLPNDDRSSIQPLLERYAHALRERYEEIVQYRRTIFVGLLLLVAADSGMFSGAFFAQGGGHALWQRYGAPIRAQYSLATRQIEDNLGQIQDDLGKKKKSYQFANSKSGGYSVAASPSGAAAPAGRPAIAAKDGATLPGGVKPRSDQPVPATKQRGGAPGPKSLAVLHEAVRVSDAYSSASSHVSGAEAPVAVDPAVMKANLISWRAPVYPEAARANHIEGRVVLQAIVSKNGSVGRLLAVDGDPVLRRAVSEAVSKWRYRPYVVNGEPVEVGTTVTVDFVLGQ
jgi:TonB family protein